MPDQTASPTVCTTPHPVGDDTHCQLHATPAIVTPEPEAVHYGVPVTCVGEGGDMLAFGHHDPRHALAAFNRHARVDGYLANVVDDRSATAADLLACITRGWGRFRRPEIGRGEDPDFEWVMDECAPDAPNAAPYTRIRVS